MRYTEDIYEGILAHCSLGAEFRQKFLLINTDLSVYYSQILSLMTTRAPFSRFPQIFNCFLYILDDSRRERAPEQRRKNPDDRTVVQGSQVNCGMGSNSESSSRSSERYY